MSKIKPEEAGCWLEGSRGQYAAANLVEIALSFPGFLKGKSRAETMHARTEARHVVKAFMAGEDTVKYRRKPRYGSSYTVTVNDVWEHVLDQGGLADMAEEFLNTLAPDGYSFGWHDGEFFLWPHETWEEAS